MACERMDHDSQKATRRSILGMFLGAAGFTAGLATFRGAAAGEPGSREFMNLAFDMKEKASELGDQPYGAIVVKDGEVVGDGPSRVIVNGDPTAHAEVEAIRDAARRLGTRDLQGCVLYASSKPCRMCETAAYWANISRVYYGGDVTEGGRPRYSSC